MEVEYSTEVKFWVKINFAVVSNWSLLSPRDASPKRRSKACANYKHEIAATNLESREHSSGRLKGQDARLTFRRCGGFLRGVIDVMNEYREEFSLGVEGEEIKHSRCAPWNQQFTGQQAQSDVFPEIRAGVLRAAFCRPLTILSNIPIVRGLVLQEWAQFSNGRVEKVKTEASRESELVLSANGGEEGVADAFLGSKLNYWVVLAALTFGNEPLNLEEELRRRSKLHFRGGNRASFAKHDFLPREDA
ncbi:hypothetical protein ALC57_00501 [Trachymyrmex cornetzi]|uniref:Uncharacterized protein n=1 Tax=Trachymyrmex cornetzi TaxID=471704 RepID=A0A151JRP8_9HYME|nr:hypothetical protein ALC57_00501 [Trachymyrmex cornetzi]